MIEVMRQVRNALVWNLNTDLDNIPACEQWSEMLRKNIDALDKAMADAELKWVGLTDSEKNKMAFIAGSDKHWLIRLVENKLKEQNETT